MQEEVIEKKHYEQIEKEIDEQYRQIDEQYRQIEEHYKELEKLEKEAKYMKDKNISCDWKDGVKVNSIRCAPCFKKEGDAE